MQGNYAAIFAIRCHLEIKLKPNKRINEMKRAKMLMSVSL